MLTTTKQVSTPRLKIFQEHNLPLGIFTSGKFPHIFINHLDLGNDQFEELFRSTYNDAIDVNHHIDLLKKAYIKQHLKGKRGLICVPIYRYEHSSTSYSLEQTCQFDSGVAGACILKKKDLDDLKAELNTYSKWANGEVYGFSLYDKKGEVKECFTGYIDLNTIKSALPKEFRNEQLRLSNMRLKGTRT